MRVPAFTLMESLIALVLMSVIIAMVYQILYISNSSAKAKSNDTTLRIERALLIARLETDLANSDSLGRSGDMIVISALPDDIEYLLAGDSLIRREGNRRTAFNFPVDSLTITAPFFSASYPWPCAKVIVHAARPWGRYTILHHQDAKGLYKLRE